MSDKLWSNREELFRAELKSMRKAAGLNQMSMAEALDKPQSFVSKYENGERQLKFLELEKVCLVCGTSLSDFSKKFSEKHPLRSI